MSKKKLLTGKKTKLAKLPLTEALSRHLEQEAPAPPVAAPRLESVQPAFSWESIEAGAAGLLAAAYSLMLQDLLSLKKEIPWTSAEVLSSVTIKPSANLPARQVKKALRQAKDDLSDLYRLLSH
jgi:hypothetical protein